MKKFMSYVVLGCAGAIGFVSTFVSSAQAVTPKNDPDQSNMFKNSAAAGRFNQGLDLTGHDWGKSDDFVQVVKNAINWVLGILALIALILLLWGGFQMVTAAGDDKKYEEGFKILKQAAFGLIMIGVAWFVVSIIFYVIGLVTT